METKQKTLNTNWAKIGLGLMFALILLPSNLKAIAILVFGVCILSLSFSRKPYFDTKFFIANSAVYLVIALTFFYSEDTEYALRKLQQFASLLVFPFIFALTTKEERKSLFEGINKYLWIYVIGIFLFNVVFFIWFFATRYNFDQMMEHFATVLRIKIGKYNIHPIYLSMHCGIAVLFSFYILRATKSKLAIWSLIVMDIILVLFLLLYAKKGPLFGLIVVFTLFVLFQRKKGLLRPYILAVASLVLLTIAIPRTRNKFIELLKIETLDKGEVTSTNIRYTIYTAAQRLIAEKPFQGYGIGDYNNELIKRYGENGDTILVEGRYNAHNQYFSLMLIGGIGALLVFLITLGLNLIYAIRFDNQILILLLLFYGIVMFTENILEREQGIIFFAFFLNFFTLKSLFVSEEA